MQLNNNTQSAANTQSVMMKQLVSEIKKHFHSEKRCQSEIYRGWGPSILDEPDMCHSSLEM